MAKRKAKTYGFTPGRARRIRKNAGGVHQQSFSEWPQQASAKGGASLFSYLLEADMAASGSSDVVGEALGTVTDLSGSSGVTAGQLIEDMTGTASHQETGGTGLCIKAKGRYIVIEPECDFASFNPDPEPEPAP